MIVPHNIFDPKQHHHPTVIGIVLLREVSPHVYLKLSTEIPTCKQLVHSYLGNLLVGGWIIVCKAIMNVDKSTVDLDEEPMIAIMNACYDDGIFVYFLFF